ncbi:MAG: class I SAM-dependent methyltransferase [Chitinivibrionales bacterium]|nr:class I SAM-dependent methyltransferase [Chitinivibrionales bacterium]
MNKFLKRMVKKMKMMGRLLKLIVPKYAIKRSWRKIYQRIADETSSERLFFMNYGYEPIYDFDLKPSLEARDEKYRCMIQLYHHLVSKIETRGKKFLEVGSGRGGGCDYIQRYFSPVQVFGIDISKKAIELAKKDFPNPNITFLQGDAGAIPYEDNFFDVVINIESSHCYPDIQRFVREVRRVLSKTGVFLIADFGTKERMNGLENVFKENSFRTVNSFDITQNVVASLNILTSYYNKVFGDSIKDKKLSSGLLRMARVKESQGYNMFKNGSETYRSYILSPQ